MQEAESELEVGQGCKLSEPTPSDILSLPKNHVPEVPHQHQIATPIGEQVFDSTPGRHSSLKLSRVGTKFLSHCV